MPAQAGAMPSAYSVSGRVKDYGLVPGPMECSRLEWLVLRVVAGETLVAPRARQLSVPLLVFVLRRYALFSPSVLVPLQLVASVEDGIVPQDS